MSKVFVQILTRWWGSMIQTLARYHAAQPTRENRFWKRLKRNKAKPQTSLESLSGIDANCCLLAHMQISTRIDFAVLFSSSSSVVVLIAQTKLIMRGKSGLDTKRLRRILSCERDSHVLGIPFVIGWYCDKTWSARKCRQSRTSERRKLWRFNLITAAMMTRAS